MAAEEEEEHLKLLPHDSRHLVSLFRISPSSLLFFDVRLVRTTRLSIIPRNPKKAHHHLLVGGSPLSIYDSRIMPNRLCVCGVLWTNKIGDLLFISLVDRLRILPPNHPHIDSRGGPFVNVRSSVATAFCIFWICARSLAPSGRDCCRQEEAKEEDRAEDDRVASEFLADTGRRSVISGMLT